jgi:hypothetical protein
VCSIFGFSEFSVWAKTQGKKGMRKAENVTRSGIRKAGRVSAAKAIGVAESDPRQQSTMCGRQRCNVRPKGVKSLKK